MMTGDTCLLFARINGNMHHAARDLKKTDPYVQENGKGHITAELKIFPALRFSDQGKREAIVGVMV